jgi:phage baseplate assembly protein gpV/phage protein D
VGGVSLEFDGAAPDAALAECLSEVEVRQSLNAPSLAVLTFHDPPAQATGSIAMGGTLALRAPDGTQLFNGEITAIRRRILGTRERSLEVRAYDRLHRLRKRQNLRQLADIGVADFAATVAGDLGLSVDTIGDAPSVRPVVIQHHQSDFDLLAQMADAAGLCFWLDGDTLKLVSLGGDDDDEIRLTVGDKILEVTSDVSAEPMRKSSQAIGWDLAANEVKTERAGMAAQDSLEMRLDAVAAFDGLGDRTLVNRLADAGDTLKRLAQDDIDRATARGLILDLLCEGDAALRPARVIRVEGIGAEADGPFVVSRTIHRFDGDSGYTTRVQTDPPARSRRGSDGIAATLGVIIDTDDPDQRYRVKARFPVLGDTHSAWMPVLSLGAGASKGFSVVPEPDDEVLVLFPDGDPARGIVLGGLYGARTAPGERPADGARAFVLQSPSGPKITLDGCKALIRLESGGGDTFEMTPDATLFRAKQDMTIEAPGRTIKIRAAHVEFEKA